MTFHDILSEAGGWAHHIDGVRNELFPSHAMAVDAARRSAERDRKTGRGVSIRYQAADGTMRSAAANASSAVKPPA
jgi:hypothetical protein